MQFQGELLALAKHGDVFARPLSLTAIILAKEVKAQEEADKDMLDSGEGERPMVLTLGEAIQKRVEALRIVWEGNNELIRVFINRPLLQITKDYWNDLKTYLPSDQTWVEIDSFIKKCGDFKEVSLYSNMN